MKEKRVFEDNEWKNELVHILPSDKREKDGSEVLADIEVCYVEIPFEEHRDGRNPVKPDIRAGYSSIGLWQKVETALSENSNELTEEGLEKAFKDWKEDQIPFEWISVGEIRLEAAMGGIAKEYNVMFIATLRGKGIRYAKVLEYAISEIAAQLKNTRELEQLSQLKRREPYLFRELRSGWMLMGKYAERLLEEKGLPAADLLTQLSAERYEGSDSEARIYFTRKNIEEAGCFTALGRDVRIISPPNMRMIRKLMEISKRKTIGLYAERETQKQEYVISRMVVQKKGKEETDTYIKFSGFMHWCIMEGKREELTYYHGRYYVNYSRENQEYVEKIKKLPCIDTEMLMELIDVIKEQSHGTSVILAGGTMEEVNAEVDRLCGKNRGIRIESGVQYQKELEKEKEKGWNKEQILSITGIDGALFMNYSGQCLGMGVLVDGKTEIKGKTERGARYNSITNYVMQRENYIGIIVSEDGMIDVVAKELKE